jgi:hypothetical protein
MGKIINYPNECGHKYMHMHCSKLKGLMCPHPHEFPTDCPLQDGMTMKDHLDSVLKMKQKSISLKKSLKIKNNEKADSTIYFDINNAGSLY